MAQIFDTKNPRTRSKIIGDTPHRKKDDRLTVHAVTKQLEKSEKKPILKRGGYNE